jgi:hypothetical protein
VVDDASSLLNVAVEEMREEYELADNCVLSSVHKECIVNPMRPVNPTSTEYEPIARLADTWNCPQ